MNSKEYLIKALSTEPDDDYNSCRERLLETQKLRLLHSAMGASTETAEILDAVKKHVFYGKKLDKTNLLEECGDVFWYLAILADVTGFDFEKAMDVNIRKLEARYRGKYSDSKAINRDVASEYKVMS